MLCSMIRSITYQDFLGFIKFVFLKEFDFYENANENAKLETKTTETGHKPPRSLQLYENCGEKKVCSRTAEKKSVFDTIDQSDLEIGEKLGAGGFGVVFAVKYASRDYALKKMHRMSTRASRESFEAEASIVHLRHPNIVRTLSVFTMDDSACILMEFVGRRTLQKVITDVENEQLPEERRLRFALDVSRGLSYAHGKGVAHLDVKPTNILITKDDVCKIGDFGCCQSVGPADNERPSSPTKSNLTGTYAYRAPELFRGEFATPQSDVYSLGICLWQMLVREKPYGSTNHHVVIFGVVAYNLRPTVPEGMHAGARYKQLMEQCWHKDPSSRPTSKQLARALEMTSVLNTL